MQNFNATTNSDGVYKATEKLLNGNYRAVAKYVSPNGDVLSEEVVFNIDVPTAYTITGNTSVNERTVAVSGRLIQISNDLNNGNSVANAEVIFYLVSGAGSPNTIPTTTNENGDYTLELKDLENGSYLAYVEYTSPTNGYVTRTPDLNFVIDVAPIKELTLNLDSKDEKGLLTFSGYLTDNGLPQTNKTVVVRFSGGQGTVTTTTDVYGKYTAIKTIQVNGDYTATAEFSVSGQNTIYSKPVSFTIAINTAPEITLTGSVGEYPKGREVTLTATVSNILGKLTNQPVNFYRNIEGVDTLLGTVNTDSAGVATYTATNVPSGIQTFVAKTTKDVVSVDSNIAEVEVTQAPVVGLNITSTSELDSLTINGTLTIEGLSNKSGYTITLKVEEDGDVVSVKDALTSIDGSWSITQELTDLENRNLHVTASVVVEGKTFNSNALVIGLAPELLGLNDNIKFNGVMANYENYIWIHSSFVQDMLCSSDGGLTFKKISSGYFRKTVGIVAYKDKCFMLAIDPNRQSQVVVIKADGTATQQNVAHLIPISSNGFGSVAFLSSSGRIFLGKTNYSALIYSDDEGVTWQSTGASSVENPISMCEINGELIVTSSNTDNFSKSADNGLTWTKIPAFTALSSGTNISTTLRLLRSNGNSLVGWGYTNIDNLITYSEDGFNFNNFSPVQGLQMRGQVIYNNRVGRFVIYLVRSTSLVSLEYNTELKQWSDEKIVATITGMPSYPSEVAVSGKFITVFFYDSNKYLRATL